MTTSNATPNDTMSKGFDLWMSDMQPYITKYYSKIKYQQKMDILYYFWQNMPQFQINLYNQLASQTSQASQASQANHMHKLFHSTLSENNAKYLQQQYNLNKPIQQIRQQSRQQSRHQIRQQSRRKSILKNDVMICENKFLDKQLFSTNRAYLEYMSEML